MPLSAQRVTQIFFDPQPPPPTALGRLSSLFGGQAPAPARLTMAQAKAQMAREGAPQAMVAQCADELMHLLNSRLPHFMMAQIIEADGFAAIDDIEWSDRHPLGVRIHDKGMDFTRDAAFMADLRARYLVELDTTLTSQRPYPPVHPRSRHA